MQPVLFYPQVMLSRQLPPPDLPIDRRWEKNLTTRWAPTIVINGVITARKYRIISPQLPIHFRPFVVVVTPFLTIVGGTPETQITWLFLLEFGPCFFWGGIDQNNTRGHRGFQVHGVIATISTSRGVGLWLTPNKPIYNKAIYRGPVT